MVSSNQRSIHDGIRKVVGSSNRGFLSLDPERQPRVPTQAPKAKSATVAITDSPASQARPGTVASVGNRGRH